MLTAIVFIPVQRYNIFFPIPNFRGIERGVERGVERGIGLRTTENHLSKSYFLHEIRFPESCLCRGAYKAKSHKMALQKQEKCKN